MTATNRACEAFWELADTQTAARPLSPEQEAFLGQAVQELSEEGKVISVRLKSTK